MSRDIPRNKSMVDSYREVLELMEAPTSVGTTDKDRESGYYNIPGKGRRFWDGSKWTLDSPSIRASRGLGDAWKSSMNTVGNLLKPAQNMAQRTASQAGQVYDAAVDAGRKAAPSIAGFVTQNPDAQISTQNAVKDTEAQRNGRSATDVAGQAAQATSNFVRQAPAAASSAASQVSQAAQNATQAVRDVVSPAEPASATPAQAAQAAQQPAQAPKPPTLPKPQKPKITKPKNNMVSKIGTDFSDIGGRLGSALRDTQNAIVGEEMDPKQRRGTYDKKTQDERTKKACEDNTARRIAGKLAEKGIGTGKKCASPVEPPNLMKVEEADLIKAMEKAYKEICEGGFAGISDEALEAAAKSQQERRKKQGYKVPGTDSMKDVIDRVTARKKGQV